MVLSKTRLNMVNYHQFAPVPPVHHFSPLKRPWHDAGAVWLKLPQLAITAPAVLVVGRMSCFDGCFGWLSGRHVAFMYKWLPYQVTTSMFCRHISNVKLEKFDQDEQQK